MKTWLVFTNLLVLIIFNALVTSAQTVEFNSKQTFTISSPGFYPFSTISNDELKKQLPTNTQVDLVFSNFLGSPCAIAPAADFSEIGPQIMVNANGEFVVDFSGRGPTAQTFGLSFVPQSGTCIFDLFVNPHKVSTSSSSGEVSTSGETLTPNAFTVFGVYLSDSLTNQLSNEMTNPNCTSSPFGIETLTINGQGGNDTFNLISNELGVPQLTLNSPRLNQIIPSEKELFSLLLGENKHSATAVYNQKLVNKTDMTKIYATGIFPSFSEINPTMLGRVLSPDVEVTIKEQVNPALAAVQHAIVSATMPWQLSTGNGFFITQGGGCVAPYCVIVEQGMIVVDPDGACTPEKLNKRRAGYKTFNPSKFFDPFPVAQATIQIPASNIVDPKHPLVSKIVRDNAYLILQPVPPGGKLIQQLKLNLKD